jgi:hypothetical protein
LHFGMACAGFAETSCGVCTHGTKLCAMAYNSA